MKNTAFFSIILFFVLNSCTTSMNNNTNNQADSNGIADTTNKSLKIRAKFKGVYLGTQGGVYLFNSEAGDDLEVYDRTNIPDYLKEITKDIKPNESDPKFDNKWFLIEYKMVKKEFYDGSKGENVEKEVPEIVNIKEDTGNSDNNQIKVYNLMDIKKGDNIFGLKVKSIEYKKGEYYLINFEGQFSVTGEVVYNDIEGCYDMNFADSALPNVKIKAEGKEYYLFRVLYVRKFEDSKNHLNNDQWQKINSENPVKLTLEVANLSVNDCFVETKCRTGYGAVDFIKIK